MKTEKAKIKKKKNIEFNKWPASARQVMEVKVRDKVWEIPESNSACEQWRIYFDQLKKDLGEENARLVWLITWQINGSTSCTTNSEFNAWLRQHEIDVSSAATRAVADASSIGGNILGLGKNLTKMISVGVPVVLGLVLMVVLYALYKTVKEVSVGDLVKVATPEISAIRAIKG